MDYDKELRERGYALTDDEVYERHYDGMLVRLERWDMRTRPFWDAWIDGNRFHFEEGPFIDHREALAIIEATVAARLEAGG